MKTKTIITIVLLLFIFGSVAYLVVEEVRSGSRLAPAATNRPAVPASQEPSAGTDVPKESQSRSSYKVIVYYFYGTARCPTCIKFEAFSNEALQDAFAEALSQGRLEWRAVNVDEPGNAHFVRDYELYSKSIVVVKIQNEKQTTWKNLERIWELVADKGVFIKYVQDEVRAYLGAK